MRLDVDISQHQQSWDALVGRVRFCEDAGFTGAWLFDHFKALYGDPDGPCMEAWTLLAGLAAKTHAIRFGALVTGVTYRHPSVLATEAVTVDHISNGRLDLGIGAAWFGDEHRELGIDFPPAGERIDRLDEAVQVMKLLMTRKDANFGGRYYQLRHATYRPLPVQRPHPPVWIGAGGERKSMRVAARQADVWHAFGGVSELARKSRLLDRYAEEAGRDPASIVRSTNLSISEPWDQVRRIAEGLRDTGFQILVVSWPAAGRPRVEEFLDEVGRPLLEGQ